MKPLISVIIPTYQRSDKLKIAIQSVLAQTFVNFEVLIMDDGSEDGTRDIVNSFKDHRIFYSWQKNTGGPASPRNNGIKIAKGEWIALLDDDDAWAENKLDEVSRQINNKNDLIYHDYSKVFTERNSQKELIKSKYLKNPKIIDLILNGNVIGVSTVVVRKELLLKINGFNENIKMAPCADYNTWLKIAKLSNNFHYIPKNLGYYKIDKSNMSNQDMTISKRLALEEFLYLLSNKDKIKLEAKFDYQSGSFYYSKKDYMKAINLYLVALKYGNLFIKLKALVKLFQTYINKVIDRN
ncbi:glycosyltransferase [Candidatus Pelagibacter sp.]|nr:glycosyltransferase [Candidatus Pelagibacter sp.]